MFIEILDQLNEYDGEIEEVAEIDAENFDEEQKKANYKKQVNKEPSLNCEVNAQDGKVTIEATNIKSIVMKFYIIDVEILFSRTPFLKEKSDEFSYVKPCHIIERELFVSDPNQSIDQSQLNQYHKIDVEIPQDLKNKNMVIEINGENKQIFKTYYSTNIKVNLIENYGELKVTDQNNNALPKVYCKVFA